MGQAEAPPSGDGADGIVDPLIGRVLNGRFSIVGPLGSGGMGKVYKAIQAPLDRVVAVKVLHPHYASRDAGFVRRFSLEASLTSKLRHPNTVTVIDYGQTEDGIFYLAMEYLEGHTLADVLQKNGPVDWQRCLHIGQQVCRSLREAHKFGIIHRDLKPANVMLLDEADHDLVKVLDFGLVKTFVPEGQMAAEQQKITQAGMLLGSPQYMAPEQARNTSDPRSDVYSFGVLMFEMLTGRPPFQAKDYLEVIVKHMKEPPPRIRAIRPDLSVPDEVEAVVMKCLAKEPSARYQSMDELLDGMRMAAGTAGLSVSTQSRPAIAPDWATGTPPPLPGPNKLTPMPGALRSAPNTPAPVGGATSGMVPGMSHPTPAPVRPQGMPPGSAAGPGRPPMPEISIPLFASSLPGTATAPQAPQPEPEPQLFSGQKESGSGRGLWVGLGAAVILVGAGAALVMSRSGSAPAQTAAPAAAPTTPASTAAAAAPALGTAPAATAAHSVKFRVSSEPAGARVFMGARDLGTTPLVFEQPAQADGTATAELIFVLDGYHPLAVTAGGSGDVVLSQRLQKKSGGGSVVSTVAPRSSASSAREPSPSAPSAPAVAPSSAIEPAAMMGDSLETRRAPDSARPPDPSGASTAPGNAASAPGSGSGAVASIGAPPTGPAKATGAEVIPFGEGMQRPEMIEGKPIEYSREAIAAHVEGLMIVKCVINTVGRLQNCRVLKGLPYMEQPVLTALYSRLYKPVTYQGHPVSVDYLFDLRLVLPKH